MRRNNKILVIDDNQQRRHDLRILLEFLDENTLITPGDCWQTMAAGHAEPEDYLVVFIGELQTGVSTNEVIRGIRQWHDGMGIVLLGHEPHSISENTETWGSAVLTGLPMPLTYHALVDTLHRARLYREAHRLHCRQPQRRPVHLFRSLVGSSSEIQHVREMMSQVAEKDVSVLITGESGTGKEVVARNLHYNSARRDKPFVPVNCGAIPAELLESELFGHEKGAFTGAISARAGRFELAEGGTLFLDEIGDMPLNMQVKILRVLQERCFERVGSNKTQSIDVRVIAATHRNLDAMIVDGSFREDLYYRLNVFPIELPSLRQRSEDIPLLINELVARMESERRGTIRFNSTAIMSLCQHEWSGNVRELANLVERMAIMHPEGVIGVNDLPLKYRHIEVEDESFGITVSAQPPVANTAFVNMNDTPLLPEQGIDLKEYINNLEMNLIQQALNDCGGVVARAADRLQVRRTTLVEKMRKYDMQR